MDDIEEEVVDCYQVLGIEKTATDTDIKKAFYRMSLKYHPDKHPDDAEALQHFHEVQIAYKTLKDPSKKYIYDTFGTKSKKEITGECEEVDETGDITVDQIMSYMKAMGMSGDIKEAEEMLANQNFKMDEKSVRKGGLSKELERAEKSGVTRIDCSKLVIRVVKRECLQFMNNFISIDFSTNSIRNIPDGFGLLQNLKILILNDNKFETIPDEIFSLNNLEIFEMERNQISEIPDTIFRLEKLKKLNFFSNKIKTVPIRLCFDLKCIQRIDLSCNFINEYPTSKEGVDLLLDKDMKGAVSSGSLVAKYFASVDKKPRKKSNK
ncbi:pre-mRNA-splicing factor cwc23, putative [Entamoeba invadens IP1]|uniref:Pre-mRNA-splicing factor cwc23, putative n=1 Tax=Entamoeba invadens IP1 TaxID=370355 RepID=A0A0A1U0J9_ENTIV|nr:pre-mRNA-splicing factor cwc23, putative [Entamoeba invadens IP1]ELP87409.1 pre-mRNA-splicing factor cwc23, putative [Entamoeba invadens IP1]|eukprot:XP_004254180.1 pre-mRNA-splicing factor cwc23, putative [Entamoeba invadens IP1]